MWKFDDYGNAKNPETEERIYSKWCSDGLTRVYHDGKVIGVFHHNDDALKFIENKVHELEAETDE